MQRKKTTLTPKVSYIFNNQCFYLETRHYKALRSSKNLILQHSGIVLKDDFSAAKEFIFYVQYDDDKNEVLKTEVETKLSPA
jgi:hypothetical protein